MNYIEQFKKDNNLIDGQEFTLTDGAGVYFFKDNLLYAVGLPETFSKTLDRLLTGEYTIGSIKFKPKEYETFYYYVFNSDERIRSDFFNRPAHLMLYQMGNCFKTEDQCKINIPNIKQKYIQIQKELGLDLE